MSKEIEEWRDIKGYEGLYQVSDWGRVKNSKGVILKPDNLRGHLRVSLWKNRIYKHFFIHRLVAIMFLPNPENKPVVGHLKTMENGLEDSTANEVWNISWMTHSENQNYGTLLERRSKSTKGKPRWTEEQKKEMSTKRKGRKLSEAHKAKITAAFRKNRPNTKQVDQISLIDGEVLATYPSVDDAAKMLGCSSSGISSCCSGKREKFKGYVWRHPQT